MDNVKSNPLPIKDLEQNIFLSIAEKPREACKSKQVNRMGMDLPDLRTHIFRYQSTSTQFSISNSHLSATLISYLNLLYQYFIVGQPEYKPKELKIQYIKRVSLCVSPSSCHHAALRGILRAQPQTKVLESTLWILVKEMHLVRGRGTPKKTQLGWMDDIVFHPLSAHSRKQNKRIRTKERTSV